MLDILSGTVTVSGTRLSARQGSQKLVWAQLNSHVGVLLELHQMRIKICITFVARLAGAEIWDGMSAEKLFSTLVFQPQTVSPHKQHTPIKHLARGRLWVDSWSIFGQMWSKMSKTDRSPTKNRLKIDPLQDPDRRLPLRREGGSVAEIKVLKLFTYFR